MQVNGCASIALENERHSGKGAPVVASSLSLRGCNEIDELLLAVYVELSIDIAPVGDGRSFRYHQFFLNAREGVALRKNDENLEFSRGQATFEGDVLAFRYERMVVAPLAGIGLGAGVLVVRRGRVHHWPWRRFRLLFFVNCSFWHVECEFASTEKRHFVKHVFGDKRVGCQEEQHHAGHARAANEHGAVIASVNDSGKLGNEAFHEYDYGESCKHANAEEQDVPTKGRLAAFRIFSIDFARYEQRDSGERHHPNHAENQNEPHVEFGARGNGKEAEQRNCEKRSERTERVGLAVRQPANCDDAREKHEREGRPGVDHGCDLDGIADE